MTQSALPATLGTEDQRSARMAAQIAAMPPTMASMMAIS